MQVLVSPPIGKEGFAKDDRQKSKGKSVSAGCGKRDGVS